MKVDSVRIFHIRDEIDFLLETLGSMTYQEFINNRMVKLSTQKSLEIIGEAAGKISFELKEKYPDVPWALMKGLRNRLTHQYFDISWSIVWEIYTDNIPRLQKQIEKIIELEGYSELS